MKIQKKHLCVGGLGQGVELGGQGGCERRIEVFGKIHKKKFGGGGREGCQFGRVGGSGLRGQGGCERRIEVFVKIHKKMGDVGGFGSGGGGRVGGVRVDVNEELKFLGKFTKTNFRGVGRGVRWGCEGRFGGGSGWM